MALTLALGVVAGALALVWMLWRNSHTRKLISKLPGPATTPLIGNALQLPDTPEGFYAYTQEHANKFRKEGLFKVELGFRTMVMLFKAEHVEKLLSSNTHIRKSVQYDTLRPWLNTGLLLSWGDKWKTRRRMLTPAFHFKILQDFLNTMNDHSEIFINKLNEMVDGPAFDIFPMITSLTLDIICESAMGQHYNAQNGDSEYVHAVGRIAEIINVRWQRPWLWPDIIFNNIKVGKEHNQCLRVLHGFTDKVIQERRDEFTREKKENAEGVDVIQPVGMKRRLAFLDLLLEASLENQLTNEDIREEVDTFMFEGHDTTAAGLAWSTYLIGRYPDVQKKLHEEMDEVFGSSNRPVTEADLKKLKYLECVVKEAQRLYPSVPLFIRVLEGDLAMGDHVIPGGTSVAVLTTELHKDEHHFPDTEKFDPDRFNLENAAGRHPYAYVPFSAGPRNCIGQKFAMNEEKVVLSYILRHFNVESIHGREEMLHRGELILRPGNGSWVKLSHRK